MNYKSVAKVLSVVFLFIMSSCNIEPFEGDIPDVVDSSGGSGEGVFTVDFDGKTFVSDNPIATVLDDVINITGIKTSTNEAFILTIFGNETGTYELGVTENTEVNGGTYNDDITGTGETWSSVVDFITSQGQVTITEIDEVNKTISGTFFFTGHHVSLSSKEFTNGVFTNVSFDAGLVSGSGNTFFAKVDGVEFIEDSVNGAATSLPGLSTIGISAIKNSLETIGLNLDSDIEPGEYELSTFGTPSGLYSVSFSESFSSETGKVVITLHDKANKRIEGTFQFTAASFLDPDVSYEVTEGSFGVTYF